MLNLWTLIAADICRQRATTPKTGETLSTPSIRHGLTTNSSSRERERGKEVNCKKSDTFYSVKLQLATTQKRRKRTVESPFVSECLSVCLSANRSAGSSNQPAALFLYNNWLAEEKWISFQEDHLLLLICSYLQFFLFNFNPDCCFWLLSRLVILFAIFPLDHWHGIMGLFWSRRRPPTPVRRSFASRECRTVFLNRKNTKTMHDCQGNSLT